MLSGPVLMAQAGASIAAVWAPNRPVKSLEDLCSCPCFWVGYLMAKLKQMMYFCHTGFVDGCRCVAGTKPCLANLLRVFLALL